MKQLAANTATVPRYAQLWSEISHDFNGIRRQRALEGSLDGHPRLFVAPGDAVRFNVFSKRWNKWLSILNAESIIDVEALAFLAATNVKSIELRLGMAWKGLIFVGTVLALQKLNMGKLLGQAVRDLVSYGAVGGVVIAFLWIAFMVIAAYMLTNYFWRINASELRDCVDLALLTRKVKEAPVHD